MKKMTFHGLKGIHHEVNIMPLIPSMYMPIFHFQELWFKVLPTVCKICMEDNLFFREFVTNLCLGRTVKVNWEAVVL